MQQVISLPCKLEEAKDESACSFQAPRQDDLSMQCRSEEHDDSDVQSKFCKKTEMCKNQTTSEMQIAGKNSREERACIEAEQQETTCQQVPGTSSSSKKGATCSLQKPVVVQSGCVEVGSKQSIEFDANGNADPERFEPHDLMVNGHHCEAETRGNDHHTQGGFPPDPVFNRPRQRWADIVDDEEDDGFDDNDDCHAAGIRSDR